MSLAEVLPSRSAVAAEEPASWPQRHHKEAPRKVRAVERAMSLLTVMTQGERPSWTLDDLCASVGFSKSTVHRILQTLLAGGFVERGQRPGTYRLGLRTAVLGAAAMRTRRPIEDVHRILAAVRDHTGESVGLSVRCGDHSVTIDRAPGPNPVSWHIAVGSIFPGYCSAAGKVLLAALSDDEIESLYAGRSCLTPFTENTIVRVDQLKRHLIDVRERGYALDDAEFRVGLRCLCMPVPGSDGVVRHAVGISAPASRVAIDDLMGCLEVLSRAATELVSHLDLTIYD